MVCVGLLAGIMQVACDMGYTGEDGDERLQLVSFHSTSKVPTLCCPHSLRGEHFEGRDSIVPSSNCCSRSHSRPLSQFALGGISAVGLMGNEVQY